MSDRLLTGPQAAALTGRDVATIRKWRERGHLRRAGLDARGRPLYRVDDVLDAERATRQRARAPRKRDGSGRFSDSATVA